MPGHSYNDTQNRHLIQAIFIEQYYFNQTQVKVKELTHAEICKMYLQQQYISPNPPFPIEMPTFQDFFWLFFTTNPVGIGAGIL